MQKLNLQWKAFLNCFLIYNYHISKNAFEIFPTRGTGIFIKVGTCWWTQKIPESPFSGKFAFFSEKRERERPFVRLRYSSARRRRRRNGCEANGGDPKEISITKLPSRKCPCSIPPLRRHGEIRSSRMALLQVFSPFLGSDLSKTLES